MYSSQREIVPQEEESKEFPILCETCLGDNPYVRMTREPYGKACKICERPFCVYRWKPGTNARYKKTEVCTTCAKLKNVCQTCILDLQYGLPVQVRDSVLEDHEKVTMATDRVNRGYQIDQLEKGFENGSAALPYGKIAASAILQRMARKQPYYKRNEAHVCSFYARGECTRGSSCPYRHEMPLTGDLAKQNIKDRFHGTNDPVANKMMKHFGNDDDAGAILPPPQDPTITTIWIGGLDETVSEDDVRTKFYQFGAIASIRVVHSKNCAFITFTNRKSAEDATKALHNQLTIRGLRMRIAWGRASETAGVPRTKRAPPGLGGVLHSLVPDPVVVEYPDANIYLNVPVPVAPVSFVAPPPPGMDSHGSYYASMDSRKMAVKLSAQSE